MHLRSGHDSDVNDIFFGNRDDADLAETAGWLPNGLTPSLHEP